MEIAPQSLDRCQYASTGHCIMDMGKSQDNDVIEVT